MKSITLILSAAVCMACAISPENVGHEIIPTNFDIDGAEIQIDRYIVVPTPLSWVAANQYCRSLSDHRHLLVLETSEEITPVSFALQDHGISEIWTDGRSNPLGTFYVWYSVGDGRQITLPQLVAPGPGEDVYFNALKLRRSVLTGEPLTDMLPFICELPTAPTPMSE